MKYRIIDTENIKEFSGDSVFDVASHFRGNILSEEESEEIFKNIYTEGMEDPIYDWEEFKKTL